ncbi:MAG TPA: kelch repeat-containing protein [Xanthobacteraceae bacterium]|nr:kelch repeat-containing protein [Xanthobacteraceae bacterium]
MAMPRSDHTSTLLPNGEVLVVGGAVGDPIAAADRYDPVGNRWSAAGSIGIPRGWHTATLLPGGTVLVAGGATINSIEFLSSTLRYTISANKWRRAADMNSRHGVHVALLLNNGLVLVVGGAGPPELYDPVRDVWSVEGDPASIGLTALRATATELADGSVLAIGGIPTNGGPGSPEVHRYVPDASPPGTTAVGVPALSLAAIFALAVILSLTAVRSVGLRGQRARRR